MTTEYNPEETAVIDSKLTLTALDGDIPQDDVQPKVDESKTISKPLTKKQIQENEDKAKLLQELLEVETKIHNYAAKDIVTIPGLISRNGTSIIKQGTINLLQGKTGTHKTRLCDLLMGVLVHRRGASNYLHFQKEIETPVIVCYIDTERTISEEIPISIQKVKMNAGYRKEEKTPNFRFTSLKQVQREKRLLAIHQFTQSIRNQNKGVPIFVVLDVATDCCVNFNNPEEALRLFDFIGALCNKYEATFLLVVHENPNSDKARGHLGTEAANKASAVLSIGFEKVHDKEVNLMCLKFLKLRGAIRPTPIYMSYNEDSGQLELASNDAISRMLAEKEQTTNVDSVAQLLEQTMVEDRQYSQKEILTALKVKYNWVDNTLKKHLKTITESKRELTNIRSEPCNLEVNASSGKETTYRLVVVNVASFETEVINIEEI